MTIGETDLAVRLQEWRRKHGLSIHALADMTDIPYRTLQGVEQGRGFRYPAALVLMMQGIDAKEGTANGNAS